MPCFNLPFTLSQQSQLGWIKWVFAFSYRWSVTIQTLWDIVNVWHCTAVKTSCRCVSQTGSLIFQNSQFRSQFNPPWIILSKTGTECVMPFRSQFATFGWWIPSGEIMTKQNVLLTSYPQKHRGVMQPASTYKSSSVSYHAMPPHSLIPPPPLWFPTSFPSRSLSDSLPACLPDRHYAN